MTAALQLSSVERLDSSAPAPGRAPLIASPSGSSFAELLQRGQATHSAPAQAANTPPVQGDEAPPADVASEPGDASLAEPAAQAPGKAARVPAKPALRAREKAATSAPAAQASPPPASADASASEAAPARHAAADNSGSWPPGTVPIDLNEWMASLRPPEPLPVQPGVAAPKTRASTADGVTVAARASTANAFAPADDPTALGPVDGAAVLRLAQGAAVSGPAIDPSALASSTGATLLRSAQGAAVPGPTAGGAVPGPVADASALVASNGAIAPKPADTATVSRLAADGAATPGPTTRAAVIGAADGAPLPLPMPATTNALQPQRSTADRAGPRRGDIVAATPEVRSAAPQAAAPVSAERPPVAPDLPAARDLVQGLLSGAAGAVPRSFDTAPLAPITLPTPLDSPDFAQVLGAQVSVLARDGVQQAEIQLNPAELGPISVRISIDDKNARVDFHAGAAATRDVIERGLPELASALREQGLTLAGGGVFQQPPDARGQPEREAAAAASQPRRFAPMVGDSPALAMAPSVPQGTLDVYA